MTTTTEDRFEELRELAAKLLPREYGDNDPADPENNWDEDNGL